jgi:RHS repeat-associated protein
MPSRSYQDSGYGKYRYGYQGSESNEEIDGTYTTEYRQLSTKTCRWWSIDPKATAYESPYVSMGNNPIWFNDVKGDSIRLLDFTKKQAMFFRKLLSDLKSKTGISFKLYKNNKGDKFLWFSEIDETKGSETARKFLLDAISSKETTMLLIDLTDGLGRGDGSSSTTADGKVIVLNATSIENRIKNTVGLNKTTFGYALTFLHELRHSAPGGKYKDYEHNRFFMPDGLKQNQTLFHLGGTEPIVNKIRKELGSNYGQRMVYGSFVIEDKLYNAFDRKGLEKLRQGEIPERYVAQDILLSPITTNADE